MTDGVGRKSLALVVASPIYFSKVRQARDCHTLNFNPHDMKSAWKSKTVLHVISLKRLSSVEFVHAVFVNTARKLWTMEHFHLWPKFLKN